MRIITIPNSILNNRNLSGTSKLVYGALRYHQHNKSCCWPNTETLSHALSTTRIAISRAVKQLEEAELIRVKRRIKRSNVYFVKKTTDNEYICVTEAIFSRPGLTPIQKLLFSYLTYRQGVNGQCWPHQRTIARDLGCTLPTVQQILKDFEKEHVLQVKHAHGGLKQGNRYRTTMLFDTSFFSPKQESRTKIRYSKSNNFLELKQDIPCNFSFGELSKNDAKETARRQLVCHGIGSKVADSMLYKQHIPPKSIFNAITNAQVRKVLLKKTDPLRANTFKTAGYIVASLNKARNEGHTVELSQRTRSIERLAIAARSWVPMGEAEFAQRKKETMARMLA